MADTLFWVGYWFIFALSILGLVLSVEKEEEDRAAGLYDDEGNS